MDEKTKRAIDEQRFAIRAVAGNILSSQGVDAAIRVLRDELRELLEAKGSSDPVSEAFESAVCASGTIVATCELCDRTYFVSDGDFDHGELEDLRKKAVAKPKKYIEESRYDMIDVGWIDGKQVVLGCDCAKIVRYEKWIWNHRYLIAKYLKLRAGEMTQDAKLAEEIAEQASAVTA